MPDRKELKKNARGVLKKHYFIIVILCLVSILFGTEFTSTIQDSRNLYSGVTSQDLSKIQGFKSSGNTWREVYEDILNSKYKEGDETSKKAVEEYKNKDTKDNALGRSEGAFASILNSLTSGSALMDLFKSIYKITKSDTLATAILIALSGLFTISTWIFLRDIYRAVLRRYLLEARTYDHVPANHLFFIKMVKKWFNACMVLFYQTFIEILWWFTIVGGIIKRYSYAMVPFIVAENPSVKAKEAVTLSRKMMNGHKMRLFLLEVTFIPLDLLGWASFGISDVLYTVPYKFTTYTEFYAALRELAIENKIEGYELLNDVYLYEKPDDELLERTYDDILKQQEYINTHEVTVNEKQNFFIRNFGIWLGSTANKIEYEDIEGRKAQIVQQKQALEKYTYALRLNPNWKKEYGQSIRKLEFIRNYTVWNLIFIFFFFSLFGWLWEVSLHLLGDGVFVNRGTMHGPWLPIYGGGLVMILTLLSRFRPKPLKEVISIVVVCGIVEYTTSFVLELMFNQKWWDYSGYFLNINGRICAEGLMVFALGGMVGVYLICPIIDAMLSRVSVNIVAPFVVILLTVFTIDAIYSTKNPNTGAGITDYDSSIPVKTITAVINTDKRKDKPDFTKVYEMKNPETSSQDSFFIS